MSLRISFAAAVTAAFFALPAIADGITVVDPYARAASPSAKAGAAFMMLKNESAQDDTLVAARTDVAARVELHTHIDAGDGVLKMVEVEEGFAIPAGETYHMKRGGDHVMLMGLTGPLEQGATIDVTLVFEKAGEMVVSIPVDNARKPEAGAHGGHGDHSGHDH
ncbi:MAG: copper chaperone PCu(A)C [Pseudomonadota bacterium]